MAHAPAKITERPPVVVVMGHIDHGKSSLLDYIRTANTTASEAGGITQHTSAYEAVHTDGKGTKHRITFIDTPGHEAFSAMRSRGAKVADIAILVVSGVEGVQVQTLEALRAILAAKIPYVVAINKMDKPEADLERTKQNLATNEIYLEGYGGSIPFAGVSAKTGKGVPELLDLILLTAELAELKADSPANASGVVIESHLDSKRGSSATLIIKNGTLARGMHLIIEGVVTPVRILEDFAGKPITEATFSSPVKIAGLSAIPPAGAHFEARANKKEAEAYAEEEREILASGKKPGSNQRGPEETRAVVPLLIKADALGTLEALEAELAKLSAQHKETLSLKVLHAGVGPITENDIKTVSGAVRPIVIGFNVKIDRSAIDLGERLGIVPRSWTIIYELQKYLADEIATRVPKVEKEVVHGKAKILRVFSQNKDKQVVGGGVTTGSIKNGAQVKILRHNHEIGRGEILELQEKKMKAKEVVAPNQFGTMIESKMTIAEGDTLEIFEVVTM